MGNELNCSVRFGKQQSEGKALLETSEILFRGEFRLKIPFSTIKSAKAADGELRLKTASPSAVFKRSSPSTAFADLIVENGIFSRNSPRKRISLVSSSAFPSDCCFPNRTEQLSSFPMTTLRFLLFFAA